MKKILKEPLVHFLLIGAGLFVFYGLTDTGTGSKQRVVVSAGRIEQLAGIFAKTWQRPPTRKELDGLIHEFVLEEVYYRRAGDMGLDRDDPGSSSPRPAPPKREPDRRGNSNKRRP